MLREMFFPRTFAITIQNKLDELEYHQNNNQLDIATIECKHDNLNELVQHLVTSMNNISRHITLIDVKIDRLETFRKDLTDAVNTIRINQIQKGKSHGKRKDK